MKVIDSDDRLAGKTDNHVGGACGHDDLKGSRVQRILNNLAVALAGPGP